MLQPAIETGLAALGLPNKAGSVERLAGFIELLVRWNRIYNLTAVRDPAEMVGRHLLDSLAVAPWLQGSRVLDVGSGAGLPGIPLALTHPALHFTLIDSNGKKTRFMNQTRAALALSNVTVVQVRVEDFQPSQAFDCLLTRAFARLDRLLALTGHLCKPDGRILALKGPEAPTELEGLTPDWRVRGCHRLSIPGLTAERWLLHLEPAGSGPRMN